MKEIKNAPAITISEDSSFSALFNESDNSEEKK